MNKSVQELQCLIAHIIAYAMNGTDLDNQTIYETVAAVVADMARVEFSDSYIDHLCDIMKDQIGKPIPFLSEDGETQLRPQQPEIN